MKNLLNITDSISDEYIESARKRKSRNLKKQITAGVSVAACAALVVGALLLGGHFTREPSPVVFLDTGDSTATADGVYIPLPEYKLETGITADLLGFFYYGGRHYLNYRHITDKALAEEIVGEYVCTIKCIYNSCLDYNPDDGYIEGCGSAGGDFYSVKGYDPEFMLCEKLTNGDVRLFVCNAGLTLRYGRELLEDRYHINERLVSASALLGFHVNEENEYFEITKEKEAVDGFLSALGETEFESYDYENADLKYGDNLYTLRLTLDNGIQVHIDISDSGYVRLFPIDVVLKPSQEDINRLAEALEKCKP